MSIGIAFKAFFAALFNRDAAERIRRALSNKEQSDTELSHSRVATESSESAAANTGSAQNRAKKLAREASSRSEAITLLSTLQREARLLDLVLEPLDQFDDAQIGAAAREVLRDCRKTLDRLFAISPLADVDEGQKLSVDRKASPNRVRLVGKSEGSSGIVVHRGWQATRCEVPKWSGQPSDEWLLAPIEVEVE